MFADCCSEYFEVTECQNGFLMVGFCVEDYFKKMPLILRGFRRALMLKRG
jgi:hypothetical protein